MSVDAIAFLPPVGAPLPDVGSDPLRTGTGTGDFERWMQQGLAETNDLVVEADRQVEQLALGQTDNLHQVMIALEKAKLQFQLVVQVRNKLLEAYQDILRMQV